MSKDCQTNVCVDGLSVHNVAERLVEEWRRSRSVQKLKEVINTMITVHGFDFNAVIEDRVNVMDTICLDFLYTDAKLPIARSLIEAGAMPECKLGYCLILWCIAPYIRATKHCNPSSKNNVLLGDTDCDFIVDGVTILLKHGARINTVQRKESGVKLKSLCLSFLLSWRSTDGCVNRNRFPLIILLLAHGACVTSVDADILLEITGHWVCSGTKATEEDGKRLLRYLRSAGCRLCSPMMRDHITDSEWNMDLFDKLVTVQAMLRYTKSLERHTQSLQFQCRRVIRHQLSIANDGKSILDGIDDLMLPPILLDYMKFKDAE